MFFVQIPTVEIDYELGENYGKPKDPQPEVREIAASRLVTADDAQSAAVKVVAALGGSNGQLPIEVLVNGESHTVGLSAA